MRTPAASSFAEDLAGDDQALDFAGAFADGAEFYVAVKLLRGIVLDETVAAEDLHGFVGHAHSGLAGVKLGHAGLLRITNRTVRGNGLVGEPRGAIDKAARGGDLRGHVRELELDGLEFADGLAELLAFLGIFRGGVAGALSHAQRERGDGDASTIENLQAVHEAVALLAQQIFLRHQTIAED